MAISNKVLPIVICSMLFATATVTLGVSSQHSVAVQAATVFEEYEEKVQSEQRGTYATDLAVDDVVVFVAQSSNNCLSSFNNNKGKSTSFDSIPRAGLQFTVEDGNKSGTYSFKLTDGSYLAWNSGVSLTTAKSKNNNSSWAVSFSGTTVTMAPKNATLSDKLFFGKDDNTFVAVNFLSKLFGNYESTRLYKMVSAGAVEDKAENYSDEVMEELITVCDPTGENTSTADLMATWQSLKDAYNALDEETKTYIANVEPNEHGDSLEMMVYQYLFILNKYGEELHLDNFMNRTDVNAVNTFIKRVNNANPNTIPTIALIGVAATGIALGVLVLKAKKEQ